MKLHLVCGALIILLLLAVGVLLIFQRGFPSEPLHEADLSWQDERVSDVFPPERSVTTFSWRGITFTYPTTWKADVWKYSSAGMSARGEEPQEVGFRIFKNSTRDTHGNTIFNFDFYIEAGGPQSGGDTCQAMSRAYVRCVDVSIQHNQYEYPSIVLLTNSLKEETLSLFDYIVGQIQKASPAMSPTSREGAVYR